MAAFCASPALAGRPLAVDDASVNETGRGHVEVWWERAHGRRGAMLAAPAYAPVQGLEVGMLLARDRDEAHTLLGAQAKWLWSAPQEDRCNSASSAAVLRVRHGNAGTRYALAALATCPVPWGAVHANLGAVREPAAGWRPSWGVAFEKPYAQVTWHVEAFGMRHEAPTFQTGLRWEVAGGWQLDGTVGRQRGSTLWSAGLKRSF